MTDAKALFDAIEECANLPRVISRASLTRALARAGLTPESVTRANLRGALESIVSTLAVYHDARDVPGLARRLEQLCEWER